MTKPSWITFLWIDQDTYTQKIAGDLGMQDLLWKTDWTLNFTDTWSEGISLNDAFILWDTSDEVLDHVSELLLDDSRFNSK